MNTTTKENIDIAECLRLANAAHEYLMKHCQSYRYTHSKPVRDEKMKKVRSARNRERNK